MGRPKQVENKPHRPIEPLKASGKKRPPPHRPKKYVKRTSQDVHWFKCCPSEMMFYHIDQKLVDWFVMEAFSWKLPPPIPEKPKQNINPLFDED